MRLLAEGGTTQGGARAPAEALTLTLTLTLRRACSGRRVRGTYVRPRPCLVYLGGGRRAVPGFYPKGGGIARTALSDIPRGGRRAESPRAR